MILQKRGDVLTFKGFLVSPSPQFFFFLNWHYSVIPAESSTSWIWLPNWRNISFEQVAHCSLESDMLDMGQCGKSSCLKQSHHQPRIHNNNVASLVAWSKALHRRMEDRIYDNNVASQTEAKPNYTVGWELGFMIITWQVKLKQSPTTQ